MERSKFAKFDAIPHSFTGIAELEETQTVIWMVNGKLHREDGPAVIFRTGQAYYYLNGSRHRSDGPALVHTNGTKEWWLFGKKVSAQEVFDQLTPEQVEKVVWEINEWK